MSHKTPLFDDSVFTAFLLCSTKAYLRSKGEIGTPSGFDHHIADRELTYRQLAAAALLTQIPEAEILNAPFINLRTLRQGKLLILNAGMMVSDLSTTIDAVRRVNGTSLLGTFCYEPIKFSFWKKPSKFDKLLLAFHSLVIGELQGHTPTHGSLVFGPNFQQQRIKLQTLQSRVRRLLRNIRSSLDSPPTLILNQHCTTCEFRARCRQIAESADNLSLLGGISESEIAKHNRNGIFTVNQLSYTFRYRRPSKRAKRPAKPHNFSLQALALRTKKVHVHGKPSISEADSAIYFDVEGLPDSDFHYLIGMLRVQEDAAEYQSFWAESEQEQAGIFQQFADTVLTSPNFQLYHYGSYDTTALKRARKFCAPNYETKLNKLVDSSTNVLSVVHSHFYFPTYSYTLKDIATYLGFNWSSPDASGIQSIIWREQWDETGDPRLKSRLSSVRL